MRRHLSATLLAIALVVLPVAAHEPVDIAMVARIKQEGLQRSRARELFITLTDRIGARLAGSRSAQTVSELGERPSRRIRAHRFTP